MKRKLGAIVLSMTMLASLTVVPVQAAETTTFKDVGSHWGKAAVERWAGYGVVKGISETEFAPDAKISRGDLSLMLYRMMGYAKAKESNPFTDLDASKYYAEAILALNAAGILKGDGTTVRPGDSITREEAAVLFMRILSLPQVQKAPDFKDKNEISAWALPAVNTMTVAGHFKGDNGMFRPKDAISRAEVTTLLDRMFVGYVNTKEVYTKDITGNVLVNVAGATLKDMKVTGRVILAEAVGEGDVTLDNITVTDEVLVRGGGVNSLHVRANSNLTKMTLARTEAATRVIVEAGTKLPLVEIAPQSNNVKLEGNIGTVNVQNEATTLTISGTVDKLTVSAAGAIIDVMAGAQVKTVESKSDNVQIKGAGKVDSVLVSGGRNVSIQTPGTKVEVGKDAGAVTVSGGGTVKPGESGTNSGTPTTPGGSGGGDTSTTTYCDFTLTASKGSLKQTANLLHQANTGKFFDAMSQLLKNNTTVITNAFDQMVGLALNTSLADQKGNLTQAGQSILAKEEKTYQAALANTMPAVEAVIDMTGASKIAYDALIAMAAPNSFVTNGKLKTGTEYYAQLQADVDQLDDTIRTLNCKTGVTETAMLSALAKQIKQGIDAIGCELQVGKGSLAAASEADLVNILTAARNDVTIATWMNDNAFNTISLKRTIGKTLQGVGVPAALQGTYELRFSLN